MTRTNDPSRAPAEPGPQAAARHIRGSTLLTAGRFVSVGIGLFTEVLLIRYLAKADYGALMYGLSVASLGSSIAVFGFDKVVGRFVPIYEERGRWDQAAGTIAFMLATIVGIGAAAILLIYGAAGLLAASFVSDPDSLQLLLIVAVLIPIQALNAFQNSLLALYASPMAIMLRSHVAAPGLELLVVLALLVLAADVRFVAAGYVAAGAIGLLIFTVMLIRVLIASGLFRRLTQQPFRVPVREILGYTLPVLSSDLVFVLRTSLLVILLESLRGTTEVAAFRAVLPIARQNLLLFQTFTLLFIPLASRLFAREDRSGLNDVYWTSAVWIAVGTFPIFAVSFALAEPVSVLLFGNEYADSGSVLALLALGQYFSAALGFNGLTLRILGHVRYVLAVNALVAVALVPTSLALIGESGALGAAMAFSGSLVVQNVLYHLGLTRVAGFDLFRPRYRRVYVSIVAGTALIAALQLFLSPPVIVGVAAALAVSFVVIGINRDAMRIGDTFPELLRMPLLRRLIPR